MLRPWLLVVVVALASLASAQSPPTTPPVPAVPPAPAQPQRDPHAKLMLEDNYDYWSDDGTGGPGLLARVYDDGTVEYGKLRGKEIYTGHVSAGTIAQLGAILNSPAVRALKPSYPALDGWGFTAITYKIRFFSGSVERKVEATNVLPIRKGHRDEYPTALLRLVCAVSDIRDAAEPQQFAPKRGDCDEFPQIAKPNLQPGKP
jgi:hypothetical protein